MSFSYSPESQSFQQPPRSSGSNWLLSLLLIGVGILILGGVLCVASIWYVVSNVDQWLVGIGREAMVAMIEESEIPEQEKTEVVAQIDRVVKAYKEDKIDQTDLERLLTEVQESPALRVIALYGIEEAYLPDSGLTDNEIADGRRTFQRLLRGVYEGKISEDVFYAALPIERDVQMNIGPEGEGGENAFNLAASASGDELALDDLREMLIKFKVMADNAQIPDEPFELDIGDEVKRVVDRALEGKPVQ